MHKPDRAGWFDDPDNGEQLRYFDGIVWTDNVVPRRTRWDTGNGSTVDQGDSAYPTQGRSEPPPNPYAARAHPSAPVPPAGAAAYHGGLTTGDGAVLAHYGLRAAAYIIDNIIVGLLSLLAGGWFLWRALAPVWDGAMSAGRANDPAAMEAAIASMDAQQLMYYSAVSILVAIVYHLVFLTRWSATPGKLLLGISVRRLERPGVLDMGTASRRVAFEAGLSALGNLPLVGFIALAVRVADLLWPLRDPMRQTLHDKFAGTVVVQGRQAQQKDYRS